MTKKHKSEMKTRSVPQAVGIGVFISVALTLLATCIIASLIVNEQCNENMIGILTNVTVGVSVFVGTLAATKGAVDKFALISGITVIVYGFLQLSIGVLFFDSGFYQPWSNLLVIGLGGVLACGIALKKNGNKRRTRSYNR